MDIVESEEKILTINKPGCEYNPDPTTYLITTQNQDIQNRIFPFLFYE